MTFTVATDQIGGSVFLSALTGLLPLLVFFVLLGVFKMKTHWCAIISLGVALVVAVAGFKMPATLALLSATQGFTFGFMPILYIIIAAVWLYNLTEESGRSADVRAAFNVVGRGDQRIQALLIAFSFCGLLEGLAGFGAPVAIVAAMLVTIGVNPIRAALATIVGNAINVGFGAMAIPVTTAGRLGGQEPTAVATAMSHTTPFIAGFVPLLLLAILDSKRGVKQLWPTAIVSGLVTTFGHFWAAGFFSYELTAVIASLLTLTVLIVAAVYGARSSDGTYPFSFGQGIATLGRTIVGLRIAILTISVVMSLAYVMNFSGQTASIGAWMAGAGMTFVFISPVLGWIGTAVTGSATSANALFAGLQSSAASTVGADPALLLGANTIGGGIGKIISPQNLTIAAGAIGEDNAEPIILRKALPYSVGLLLLLSAIVGITSFIH